MRQKEPFLIALCGENSREDSYQFALAGREAICDGYYASIHAPPSTNAAV